MEPAKIDWNNIESIFVEDPLYEHINAPKWMDFSAPDDDINDEAWFCKADCRHPKTAEDFLGSATKVKHQRSASVTESLPLRERNTRGAVRLNKSKTFKPHSERSQEDQENNNQSTPPEKRKQLKSTLSASNLFAGREIFNQITEFCSELKKMVMKSKDGENLKNGGDQKKKILEENVKEMQVENNTGVVEKAVQSSNEKKPRKLRMADEKENSSPVTLDLKKVNAQGQERQGLLQVRTNPPSPQCFSAYREPLRRAKPPTPLKLSKTINAENGVLQEVGQSNYRAKKEEEMAKKVNSKSISIAGKEARSMEMFWLLKPCIAK